MFEVLMLAGFLWAGLSHLGKDDNSHPGGKALKPLKSLLGNGKRDMTNSPMKTRSKGMTIEKCRMHGHTFHHWQTVIVTRD